MDPEQIVRTREAFPHTFVALSYCATEAIHEFTNKKAYEEKLSSSGTFVCESEIKITDLGGTGKPVGPSREDEFRIKSLFQMCGYHNFSNPDVYDEYGFYKTGDLGYYDEVITTNVYVTNRLSEMFKYKTYHVTLSLVEHALLNPPAVTEAVVFGVFHPVDRNHAAACVVLKSGSKADKNELIKFVNSKMSDSPLTSRWSDDH